MLHQLLVHIQRLVCQMDSLFILLIFAVNRIIFTQFNLQQILAHLLLPMVLLRIPQGFLLVTSFIFQVRLLDLIFFGLIPILMEFHLLPTRIQYHTLLHLLYGKAIYVIFHQVISTTIK